MTDFSAGRRSLALTAGLVAATIIPIGIHTLMLDDIGIPYPSSYPKEGWPVLPDRTIMMLGLIYLARAARGRADSNQPVLTTLWVFLCTAAINQDILREGIMRNSVSTKWTIYPFLDNLPILLTIAAISCLAVAVSTRLHRRWSTLPSALLLAIIYELLKRGANTLFSSVTLLTSKLEGDTRYFVPYDWHVNLPSYLSFAEPVLGACGVAAIFAKQPGSRRDRTMIAAATIFAVAGGPAFKPLINIYFASQTPLIAVLSYGQFTLETLALALMVAALWLGLGPSGGRRSLIFDDRERPADPSTSSA